MQARDEKQETVTFRGKSRDEAGLTRVQKVEVPSTLDKETMKHVEKKLTEKGVHRKDRHPVDGLSIDRQTKAGHGGKYTWEGPTPIEMDEAAPAAIDEKDPNYVDEEAEGRILRGEVSGVEGMVVGEVEVAKMAVEGVARVDVDPRLQT